MSYQKCPICDGNGTAGYCVPYPCDVCGGQKIINEQTGLPPKREVISDSTVGNIPAHLLGEKK